MKKSLPTQMLTLLVMVLLLSSGCVAPPAAPEPTATNTPAPTATATNTPQPTATPQPTHTATPVPTATRDWKATQMVKSTEIAVMSTQAALDLVSSDLKMLEISPQDGSLKWKALVPITMSVDEYGTMVIHQLREAGEVGDFVMKTKITWDSTSGFAGCAVKFRAEDDFKNGAYYVFEMMRLQFQPGWNLNYVKFNRIQTELSGGDNFTNKINDEKDSTNDVIVVARGNEFSVYINGTKVKTATHDKLKKGLVGFFTWQESGKTTCTFHDGWIWEFNEPAAEGG